MKGLSRGGHREEMIFLKTEKEILEMQRCNRIVAQVLRELGEMVEPGITTRDLNDRAEELLEVYGGEPAFKGYRGYPASVCISINEQIVHGIPGG